ncbi:MAG: alpha/beta fold hydrolase [Chloroflexota bacterium]
MTPTATPVPQETPATPTAPGGDATAADPVAPSESTARMLDGTLLRTLHWPSRGEPWATALIVHGLGEHAGRYATVAGPLAGAGIDVHGYDHRGFGGSAGPRAYVDHWSQFHDDLQERLTALRLQAPDRPLILYGHSMGGLVAGGYVLADPPRPLPDLLVLSAPGFDDSLGWWRHALAAALVAVVPRMRVTNGTAVDGLSHDPTVRADFDRDPLTQASSTVRFGHEASSEQARVRAAIRAIAAMPVPTYVFHGSADPIVPVAASEPIGTKGNVTRRVHDGLRHETHHEPEHERVMAEVVAWLLARRAPGEAIGTSTGAGDASTEASTEATTAGV